MSEIDAILSGLAANSGSADFPACCEEAVARIKGLPTPQQAVEPLLDFMAGHPNLPYGMPGAFVHFIETFPEAVYADALVSSIRRQPTEHNTWMLLRIMNTWQSPRQDEYIRTMQDALLHPGIAEGLRQTLAGDLEDFTE